MLVVKLGGSLYNTAELQHWLTTLEKYSKQQSILIVPGGGPFAEHVRTAQNLHHFDDNHAHHMALLAMTQFAILIAGIEPQCQLVRYSEITELKNLHYPFGYLMMIYFPLRSYLIVGP